MAQPALTPIPATSPAERQQQLLADAGRYLAGGGLGLFVIPPELNLVIARGEGSRVWDVAGREYIDYHLSSGPALLGHAHPAITAAVAAQLPQGHDVLLPERAGDRARAAAGRRDSLRRRRPLHRLGHRGDVLCAAHRARLHAPQQGPEVRGRVARHARLRAVGHGAERAVRLPARAARFGRRSAAGRRNRAGRAVQRDRASRRDDRAARARARGGDRRAAAARAAARARLPRSAARGDAPPRHRPHLRRDRHRLSHRVGRRAGALRRRARPRLLRQGGERRLSARGDRRPRRRDGACSTRARDRAPNVVWATNTLNGNPVCAAAGCAALDVLAQPGVYDRLSRDRRAACAPASSRRARGTASRCRRRARTRCSASASPTAGRCARGWTSPPPTRTSASAGRSSS